MLDRYDVNDCKNIFLGSTHQALRIGNAQNFIHQYDDIDIPLDFSYKNNSWYVNKKKLQIKTLMICNENKEDLILYNDHYYQGTITLLCDNNFIYVINTLPIEDYVENVLHCETYPSWSLENTKVCAIVMRTFALHQCLKTSKYSHIYDIKATRDHQVYRGIKNKHTSIKQAVDETRGLVIIHEKKPIIAMYDTCCGGVVPAQCSGFDFKTHPYLARKYSCNFCIKSPYYEWNLEYLFDDICQRLSEWLKKTVIDFHIKHVTYSKTGAIKRITLIVHLYSNNNKKKGKKHVQKIPVTLRHSEVKKLFNISMSKYSACFSVKRNEKNISIKGKGRGHHMGMCQYGAHEMAKDGKDFKKIIQFYFPGTSIEKYIL